MVGLYWTKYFGGQLANNLAFVIRQRQFPTVFAAKVIFTVHTLVYRETELPDSFCEDDLQSGLCSLLKLCGYPCKGYCAARAWRVVNSGNKPQL